MTINGISPPLYPQLNHTSAQNPSVTTTHLQQARNPTGPAQNPNGSTTPRPISQAGDAKGLSEEERRQVAELQARDQQVRAHEAAHKNAAGGLAQGSARFTYTTGPDGKRYATGGEVSIDTAKVQGDPEATLEKATRIRSAALAPAQPSSQDLAIAAKAAQMAAEARSELISEKHQDPEATGNEPGNGATTDKATSPNAGARQAYQHAADQTRPKGELLNVAV